MLVTKQKVLKKFWYPVVPLHQLTSPFSFTLLGEKIVVWQDGDGHYAALQDRCCHRSAMLSKGHIQNGCLTCAYHGWQYNREGQVVHIPQMPQKDHFPNHRVPAFKVREKYGYLWVALDEPLFDIPNIVKAFDPSYRLIPEFYELWHCASLRVMENELDLAHPAFVHQQTFGKLNAPIPDEMTIEEFAGGLTLHAKLRVKNPTLQQKNLHMLTQDTTRHLTMTWYMPFTCALDIGYPNGLHHVIVNTMTPIHDGESQMVQFCLRNDTEDDTKASDVIAFDRLVTLEDKAILESTDYDVPLEITEEKQLFTDKPGIMMRKQFKTLFEKYGEKEFRRRDLEERWAN